MSANLTEQIRASLVARRGLWREVADKSGVSYSWISKFMNGHIPNPGMRTLTRLKDGIRGVRPTARDTAQREAA
ncbi:hypothetical protein CAL20_09720 [Bordetella genomosp. 4]|uniref:HTH cro/C1-type domain-containing protein n=1 Tax=Bordetella genomosp. 4 TaxID=463044 RepID=A0A261U6T5_9BORD|nr:hypothetical protein CAL20_09720 [Bordetella genomosp. 4]